MTTRHDSESPRRRSVTLAAIFATEASARNSVQTLHKAGFRRTWLGTTREADPQAGAPMVESDGSVARYRSAGDYRRSLQRVLVEHGVAESAAQTIEGEIAPGCVIVTVCGEDDPARAAEILAEDAGDVVGTATQHTGIERRANDRDRRQTIAVERGDVLVAAEEFISTRYRTL